MKPRLLIIYLLIVVVPLAAVAWLGAALAQREQAAVAMRFRDVIAERLNDVGAGINGVVEKRARDVQSGVHADLSVDDLRRLAFESSLVRQYFIADGQGRLIFPAPEAGITGDERAFLVRTQAIWDNGEIPNAVPEGGSPTARGKVASPPQQGWHAGYWEQGVRLLYWWRDGSDRVVGAEINEMRLMSDVIAVLPEAWPGMEGPSPLPDGRIELVDERGGVMYQWGGYAGRESDTPLATVPLQAPLHFWSLRYFAAPDSLAPALGAGVWFNVMAGVLFFGLALTVMAAYFYREHTRAMREAAQRVSFVNQVSHELKTPLTNIRLYAELLDEDMADAGPAARKRLDIIVSESQRLSRLIGNVLTFSREEHKGLTLRKSVGSVDDTVRTVVDQFEEPLRARGVRIELNARANQLVEFDRDALGQILGNLLSNTEKYAGIDGNVRITTSQSGATTTITVADEGPGIPREHASGIFKPFHRISNAVNEGVSGVGLGLTIARRLAQLHGGDLTLQPSTKGASFCVTLHTPPPTAKAKP